MFTVAETDIFRARAAEIWTDDERIEFCTWIAQNPEAGDVIPGSGGCRKVRWARAGIGKRGGARVIYFNRLVEGKVWLLTMYTKTVRGTIPARPAESDQGGIMKATKAMTGRELGEELLAAVKQMKKGKAARETRVDVGPIVRARVNIGASQSQFATLLGVSARTLQDWEQGRRQPTGAAKTLLRVAAKHPEVLREIA